jgi:PAS domain S-box-containing protein
VRDRLRSVVIGYVVAATATAGMVLLRWLLDPWMGENLPLVTLYGAIASAVWYGGYRPAVAAVVLGFLACDYLFIEPRHSFSISEPHHYVGIVLYLFTCLLIIGFGEVMRLAQRHTQTERWKAEATQSRLAVLVESSEDAIYSKDLECKITSWNRGAERLYGYTAAEVTGKPVSILVPSDLPDELPAIMDRLRKGERIECYETVRVRKDGRRVDVSLSVSPMRNKSGKMLGVSVIAQDITARKRAEEEVAKLNKDLRDRLEEWQTVLNMVPVGIGIAHDPDCRRITHNPYISDLLGVGAWENASLSAPEDERPATYAIHRYGKELSPEQLPMQRACTGVEVQDFECDLVRQGQPPIRLVCSARPLRDAKGRIRGSVGVTVDITARKQAEDRLLESERRLAAELEAITRLHALITRLLSADDLRTALDDVLENAIVTSGADFGNIQLYDPQAEALVIVAQRGFRPDFLDYFRLVRVDEDSACGQAMQSGQRIIIEDVELAPTYEKHRHVAAAAGYRAVQSTPLKSRSGTILGMLSTHFRLPQRVSERNQRLLDLYARHAADLIERMRIEQALKEADRRKDEFLATLAHELRNPLAPLRNALELLRLADDNKPLIEQARSVMERQVAQMVRLVDDLLDVSRIVRGKLELRKERVELADVLKAAIETARPLIEASAHELTVTLPPEPIPVLADPIRLSQVFANLLNNAAKYTESSGHIWLTTERWDREVAVSVRDTGIGIAAEDLPRIFGLFLQVETALERSQGGLGIGLSLARGLVELHGGTIEARSAGPGKGSEFTVQLPIVAEQGKAAHEPASSGEKPESSHKCRILVVDDLRDAADSMATMLRVIGHETRTAYDGLEAVQTAAAFRPHVVLLDIGLPKINGYEAARRIRSEPWGRNVALVALTGWGQEEDKQRSVEAGFDHHLTKPVDPAALEKLLALLIPQK